ncbi:hypothetical protein TRFO_14805 [Tritrichomonas foetus]|uniref:Macro domain-containing protein n=1 Tax=Tritrichomonas foetus TaxID=1144522 RepID=A0A1J4KU98_9EUKA|nr:hypothetical protein TRFO_14805 [Tritrichomonas foetus]|eukprot:OHT14843.1 hypothetical protein TRFO_14805 [Tritrichomonas foetus]
MTTSNLEIVEGDLLSSKEKYIVHQCNCISKGAKGLAKAIYDKYPYADAYKIQPRKDTPGTIKIAGNGKNQRFIINLFGQYKPGKPRPGSSDSVESRLQFFKEGLSKILEIPNLESIAFPFNIGCGLAGGDWNSYYAAIEEFATHTTAIVKIYKLSP